MAIADDAVKPGVGDDVASIMHEIGVAARAAARTLALAPRAAKDAALRSAAGELHKGIGDILAANGEDIRAARDAGQTAAFIDRLMLDEARIEAMAEGLAAVAGLPDPVGRVLARWTRPNGLAIERVAVPLGVIGIIYESRPNVTADAGALCLKSGNAAILRGGSDSFRSSAAIHRAMRAGIENAGLPATAVQLVPVRSRDAVGLMLTGLGGAIDVIVPRGGKSLVARVERDARVPVFSHLEGICHVYVDAGADLDKAVAITVNAKMRRTGICGAAETLLVDRAVADTHLAPLVAALIDAGCAIRGDRAAQAADPRVAPASAADWDSEYLDAIMTVGVVDGVAGAIGHIAAHGSNHTDAIITEDRQAADRFVREVDSAIVLVNASTQFADGGEFGFGAEIGIATGKLHARGPVGLEQLTSFKYVVRGEGQTRP
jgi:glutamate-5-semialdehyde dehydrogenase